MAAKTRAWCFTKNTSFFKGPANPGLQATMDDYATKLRTLGNQDNVKYLVYQWEAAPETKRIHIQGYINYENKKTFNGVKADLWPDAHIEAAKGTPEACKKYCTKEDSRYHEGEEIGNVPVKGKRTDLDDCIADIQDGANLRLIAINHPQVLVKYSRGIETLIQTLQEPPVRHPVSIFYWTGISGAGKTRWATQHFFGQALTGKPWRRAYNVTAYTGQGPLWMGGYTDQLVCVFDEFAGSIPRETMLQLMDGQAITVTPKGKEVHFHSTVLVFLSNKSIPNMYRNTDVYQDVAFHRRLEEFGIDIGIESNRKWVEANIDRILQDHAWAKKDLLASVNPIVIDDDPEEPAQEEKINWDGDFVPDTPTRQSMERDVLDDEMWRGLQFLSDAARASTPVRDTPEDDFAF